MIRCVAFDYGQVLASPETIFDLASITKPLVVRLDGNNVDEGRAILDELNHPLVTQVDTMDGAADKAAELANG